MFTITLAERFEMAFDRAQSAVTLDGVTLVREFVGASQFVTRPGVLRIEVQAYLIDAISDALKVQS